MPNIFDFLQDMHNYEDRKLAQYREGDLYISTARVSDSIYPFETGIAHPAYNSGDIIVVENYNNKQLALIGHKKWVKIMTTKLPEKLADVGGAAIRQFLPEKVEFKKAEGK